MKVKLFLTTSVIGVGLFRRSSTSVASSLELASLAECGTKKLAIAAIRQIDKSDTPQIKVLPFSAPSQLEIYYCRDSFYSVILLTQCTTRSSPVLLSVSVSGSQGLKQIRLQVLTLACLLSTQDIKSEAAGKQWITYRRMCACERERVLFFVLAADG